MRQLTKNEIEKAPDWATDFAIIKDQVVMIGGGQITKTEGQKVLWSEVLETDFEPIPRKEFEAIRNSFVTCNSDGEGHYNVTLEAKTLKEAHAIHREILKLRLR